MKASASYSNPGKIQVKGNIELKGAGIKLMGRNDKGEFKYILTQKAFDKISHNCIWE
jgi:hypothetical protein